MTLVISGIEGDVDHRDPVFEEPECPAREYWADKAGTIKTNNKSRTVGQEIVQNAPVAAQGRLGARH